MRVRFSSLLCLLCAAVVNCSALDREAFTFTKYDLDVRIEPQQQRLAVRGKISLRNDSAAPQSDLALQISSSLDWRSIRIAGQPVRFVGHEYTSDIDHTGSLSEAVVVLPRDMARGDKVEIEVGYEGTIPLDASRLARIGVPDEKAKHSDWDLIGKSFTAVRGAGYVAWYPVSMEASLAEGQGVFKTLGRWKAREAVAEMKITLTYSGESSGASPAVVCNGKEGKNIIGGSGGDVRVECSFMPLGFTVPAFAIAHYSLLDRPSSTVYYLSEHKPGAERYAIAEELALPFVTQWFGKAGIKAEVVELADPDAAPFETDNMVFTPLAGSESRWYALTSVHQLTHASFPSQRQWIYEGLAHFAQAAYLEHLDGRQAALDFMGLHRTAIADTEKAVAAERDQNKGAGESLINTNTEEFYRSKAMYVWWMLRDTVGEDVLQKTLAAYRPDQDKEPSYLPHLIQKQTKRDLEWFFDDWVYRDRGLPDFRVESVYSSQTLRGSYLVTVSIENLGSPGAEVPVTVRVDRGEVSQRLEVRGKSKNTIRIEVSSLPREVVVNDGSVPESDTSNNTFKIESAEK